MGNMPLARQSGSASCAPGKPLQRPKKIPDREIGDQGWEVSVMSRDIAPCLAPEQSGGKHFVTL